MYTSTIPHQRSREQRVCVKDNDGWKLIERLSISELLKVLEKHKTTLLDDIEVRSLALMFYKAVDSHDDTRFLLMKIFLNDAALKASPFSFAQDRIIVWRAMDKL